MKIKFNLNNCNLDIDIPSDLKVVDLLREHLNLTGTKEACGSGECGACTILVNGKTKLSCLMLAAQLNGKSIITIEGVGNNKKLHPIQEEFIKKGAIQCGFCTPGMIMSAIYLLNKKKNPTRQEIREGISGNICRCTGYNKIVDAIEAVTKSNIDVNNFETHFSSPEIIRLSKVKENAKVFLPTSIDNVFELLTKYPDAKIYAGGTDVLTKRRKGLIPLNNHLICIGEIKELKKIYEYEDEIFIGSAITHSELLDNEIIKKNFPVLIQALNVLGSPQIRNMATIGGNICTASPAGDSLPPLYVLDATLEIRSKNRKREIKIKDFIQGVGKIDINSNEILYGIKIKKIPEYNFQYYEKIGQRNALSISITSIGIIAQIEKNIIKKIKIAWGSVAPTVITSEEIEEKLVGKKINENTLKSVFPIIEKVISPIDDIRASKKYRLAVAKNLILRISHETTRQSV